MLWMMQNLNSANWRQGFPTYQYYLTELHANEQTKPIDSLMQQVFIVIMLKFLQKAYSSLISSSNGVITCLELLYLVTEGCRHFLGGQPIVKQVQVVIDKWIMPHVKKAKVDDKTMQTLQQL
jgi:predicted branched-subunit amino acid permease